MNKKSWRKIFSVSILLIFFSILFFQSASIIDFIADHTFLPNKGIRKATYSVWTQRGVGFITSDKISLLANIHHPKGLKKTPTILVRIPFTKTVGNSLRSDIIGRYWARRGYTVVIQGTRGRYESGGNFYPLIHERQDGNETLQWLENQPWFNGHVVMWGGSAFGHTQWAIADNKKIDGFFIQIASTNFHDMFYPGNAFALESALNWAIRSRGTKDRDVSLIDLERGVQSLPIIDAAKLAIGDTNFYNDWLLQKDNQAYWKIIDGQDRIENLHAPVLLMAGWFDPFLVTQIKDFEKIKAISPKKISKDTRLIIGPWAHATALNLPNTKLEFSYRKASLEPSIPWFDYLVGKSHAPLDMAPVRIFVMGINEWRDENNWPLARTQYTSFYFHSKSGANSLHGDGILSKHVSGGLEKDHFLFDPLNPVPSAGGAMLGDRSGIMAQNKIEERDDVLVYTTTPLRKPIEVTGPIKAILYVSTDAPSTDFTVKLVDVYPDGAAYNLSDGIIRRQYTDKSAPTRIEVELWPTSNVFLENHRIRLEISSSNFPKYDRNLNTGDISPTTMQPKIAHQVIYHSKQYPSHLILPIIPS